MKKILSLLVCLCLLAGCVREPRDPGVFYYRRIELEHTQADGVIAPETRELLGLREDLGAILELYLSGPTSGSLESPFPRNTTLKQWSLREGQLQIVLSPEFAQLTGVELSIAAACIARTFLNIEGVDSLRIQAEGQLLGGSAYLELDPDSLFLEDDSLNKLRTELTIYYTDWERRYLMGSKTSLNLAQQDDICRFLVELLMQPPKGMASPLPVETQLLDANISDGICTLNFNEAFLQSAYPQSYAQRTTLLSLVNTLTQLEQVEAVDFKVEGSLLAQYRSLNLSGPMVFDESAVGPVRTGVNEFDATLYLCCGNGQGLVPVPTRLRQLPGIDHAELIVMQLLTYSNPNGFYSPVPPTTVVNSVTVSDKLCTVDLNRDLLRAGDRLSLAVHAIAASVCTLENVDRCRITVNGTTPQGDYADLFEVLKPSSNWYLSGN